MNINDAGAGNYFRDIFYDTLHLSLAQKKELLKDAKKKSFEWSVDILDCTKSWARQSIKMSFSDILKKLTADSFFVVIHRKGYENWKNNPYFPHKWCMEIGFVTHETPSHFLFVYIKEDVKEFFLNKYNLKEIE